MANSCSYIRDGFVISNNVCFQSLLSSDEGIIIIEKGKQFYPIEEIFEYFEELQKTGWPLLDISVQENKDIHIKYQSDLSIVAKKYFCITARFLWEGKFTKESGDNFYIIHDHFMRMCRYYPEADRGLLLCIAHDLFQVDRKFCNTNHTLCYGNIKILNSKNIIEVIKNGDLIVDKFSSVSPKPSETDYTSGRKGFNFEWNISTRDNFSTKEDYDKVLSFYENIANKKVERSLWACMMHVV